MTRYSAVNSLIFPLSKHVEDDAKCPSDCSSDRAGPLVARNSNKAPGSRSRGNSAVASGSNDGRSKLSAN